jgi:hypothetical protein
VYGPRPVAQYPAWVTCVADVRAGTTTTFDFARVTGVALTGTDWAGKGADFVDIRYVAFITPDAPMSCDTFAEARSMKDGTSVKLVGLATMANSPDAIFAIEDYWRNLALPVRELAGRPKIQAAPHGRMVVAAGTVQTDPTSQTRYLSAKWWTYYGSESAAQVLKPKDKIAVRCEDLAVGSKDFHARCLGHEVELTARVTGADAARGLVFLADPASGTAAPSVAMTTSAIPCWQRPAFSRGDLVTVTGVCCLTPGPDDTWQPLLRVRARKDVTYHFAADNQPKTIRVFVLSCDPRCPAFGNKRTHEIFGWSDPRMLAAQFIQAILESSNGWARYEIARWHDADWGNNTPVLSTCDDWLYNWPMLQGATTQRWVASVEWGGGAMDKHHIWWLNHIPKAAGVGPDGKQNNWWKYICDYNTYVP